MIWLAILACMLISFTFSGIESGVLSVNRVRLRHFSRQGEEAAVKLDSLLMRVEQLMITVLLITNTANVLAVVLLYHQLTRWLGPWGALLTVAVCLPVSVFGLEFLPKAIFQRFPYRTLVIFARILTVAHWIFWPIVAFGTWLTGPIFRTQQPTGLQTIADVEDIKRLTDESVATGRMPPNQRNLMHNVVDFRRVLAADAMLPLEGAPTVQAEAWISDILQRARDTGHDHFPVLDPKGDVVGLIRAFDLLIEGVTSGRAQSYMRQVLSVQGGEPASEVLRKLRAGRMNLAVVIDPSNRPAGVLLKDHLIHRMLAGK